MNQLFSKIYGCEACGTIGNAMGDVTEGLEYQEIEAQYGFVDKFYEQYKKEHIRRPDLGPIFHYKEHYRPPGTTEDGMERHRLCTSAILKKGGRIDIVDLAKTWAEDIDPAKFGYLMGPQDQIIYYSIKAGVPPWEVGKFASWPTLIGTSKMIMPVGMVNACNPQQAAQDAFELGRIKDTRGVPGNYSLEVCAAIAAATAEALKPTATVDSIIDTALSYLTESPLKEVQLGLNWAKNANSWKDLRPLYAEHYKGKRISNAVEILSGGLACFWMADGQPRDALLNAVNLGRDTDCKAYVAGGLSGALRGIEAVPADWVQTVEEVTAKDPWTVSNRTARQAAEGLYQAAVNTKNRLQMIISELEEQL